MRNILVVDDHQMVCEAMLHLMEQRFPGIAFAACHSMTHLMATLRDAHAPRFDLIIMDYRMPGARGLDSVTAVVKLARARGGLVIVYTGADEDVLLQRLGGCGAFAVISKRAGSAELNLQIEQALNARTFASATATLPATDAPEERFADTPSRPAELTERQMEILEMLHRAVPNKVIARDLGMAVGTVKNHLHAVFQKLQVTSRTQALTKTREWF